ALCRAFGGPVVSSSAILAGAEAARTAAQVRQAFGYQLDYLLSGPLGGQERPSTIRDLSSGAILR
ncbi:MAG: Sua5/YciO/YrdC/YwlC family protein, partial [Motiliproteus sp.]